jgi:hypothetical protein
MLTIIILLIAFLPAGLVYYAILAGLAKAVKRR